MVSFSAVGLLDGPLPCVAITFSVSEILFLQFIPMYDFFFDLFTRTLADLIYGYRLSSTLNERHYEATSTSQCLTKRARYISIQVVG